MFKKDKNLEFAKVNSFGTEFLIHEAKKVFLDLQNFFNKAPIYRDFDAKSHIWIDTNALGDAIGGILSQMIFKQLFSHHVIYKSSNSS